MQSKLYGHVVLFSFRNYARDVRFVNCELATKLAPEALARSTIKVEVEGPPLMKGVPGRKECVPVCHLDNLIVVNLSPCLSRTDTTSCYDFIRGQKEPQTTLKALLAGITKQLKLTQMALVIDRVELMAALIGA